MEVEVGDADPAPALEQKKYNFKKKKNPYGQIKKARKSKEPADVVHIPAEGTIPASASAGEDINQIQIDVAALQESMEMWIEENIFEARESPATKPKKKPRMDGNWRVTRAVESREKKLAAQNQKLLASQKQLKKEKEKRMTEQGKFRAAIRDETKKKMHAQKKVSKFLGLSYFYSN